MPIEIRELNIRISVAQNQQEQGSAPSKGNSGANASPDKDELISECLEQVSDMLRSREER